MEEKQLKISTTNTYLNLAAIILLISGALWLGTKLARIEADIAMVRVELVQMQERVNIKMGDRWTATMMGVWAREFQNMNLTNSFRIPIVQEIQMRHPPGSLIPP